MNTNPTTTTTSVEVKAEKTIWGRVWAYQPAKEFLLMLATTVGLQLGVVLLDLSGKLSGVNDLSALYTTVGGWGDQAITSIILTVVRQTVAWSVARLAGTKL